MMDVRKIFDATATPSVSLKVTVALFIIASVVRLILVINLPLVFIPGLYIDDGLYIRLATDLASGRWLGDFDKFTLAKGPGYPVFLAISNLSGLPISVTHNVFQVTALIVTAWAIFCLTTSRALAAISFLVLAFHPVGFVPELNRVFRDQIYWSQALLVFSLFAILFLAPPRRRSAVIALSGVAGLALGWTWLTREEGVWLLPGLSIVALAAGFLNRRMKANLISLAQSIVIAASAFVAVIIAFMTCNLISYGSFAGVDFKEQNFTAALNALHAVDVGPLKPYVPVPRAVLSAVSKISPSFEPLAASLEPGKPLFRWATAGCKFSKETCGEYAGAYFVWALRDAAAENGLYDSPQKAAQGFKKITREIEAACSNGALRCRSRWLNKMLGLDYMPSLTTSQWMSIPRAMLAAVSDLCFFTQVEEMVTPTSTDPEQFEKYWSFLNFPRVRAAGGDDRIVLGWFYNSSSNEWPKFRTYLNGEEVPFTMVRYASPDLQKHFANELANRNRFKINFHCPYECLIAASTADGPEVRLPLHGNQAQTASSGSARLHVDSVSYGEELRNPGEMFADSIRVILIKVYKVLSPLMLASGLLALVWATGRAIKVRKKFSFLLVAAIAAWALVVARVGILSLTAVSSFSTGGYQYSAPAIYLGILGAFLAIGALCERRTSVAAATEVDAASVSEIRSSEPPSATRIK
jgi:hypothetical protein